MSRDPAPRIHHLVGTAGSDAWDTTYAQYYASIAHTDDRGDGTVRHRLRPEVGDGTIEVTPLRSGFQIVRYDVVFAGAHRIGFRFPGDHFELEHCLDGRMHVREDGGDAGDLCAGSVALSPARATGGVVTHDAGERYRAVSVTGTWSGLESYLGAIGRVALPATGPEEIARGRYLGGAPTLRPVAPPLREIFTHRRTSPGRPLFLESRLAAALGALVDGLAPAPSRPGGDAGPVDLDEHEIVALRRIPGTLWRERHDPPDLDELARRSSMSVRRLAAGFRALYGTTVWRHHRRCCLDRAAVLLVETGWPVARIGHEVGYASPSNFVYAFRTDRGITPARFRASHAERRD